jgi:hypothetical protein
MTSEPAAGGDPLAFDSPRKSLEGIEMDEMQRRNREPLSETPEIISSPVPEPVCDWRDIDAWPALSGPVDLALSDPPGPLHTRAQGLVSP